MDQAVLRNGSTAVRLAINAARRFPRDQGIWVSVWAAVSVTFLIKRELVFMSGILNHFSGALPLIEYQYDFGFGLVLDDPEVFSKYRTNVASIYGDIGTNGGRIVL